ncbi:hypothetical protein HHL19_34520 [Streptomyces sp. R302]|uniref:hypothetical protein n=1 Tax=unclassified Streptomyces TaxID=2593676 RepID=UPI00145C760A|nr:MULTISPECIES: hypothetical protein [unclassified Streptomyces]NML54939.1 hypothetical protein [Streptomyces sp. R301]NML83626.1 hypothetical protein [Streptomyces sp. R302]
MRVMSKGVLGAALAAFVVLAAGTAAGATGDVVGEAAGEADLAHHGHVSLWDGRVGVWLVTENHGPSDVADATVRLAFSAPMAGGQELPPGCLWSSARVVSCRTGALSGGGAAGELALDLRAAGRPQELTVDVSTAWRAGGVDRNSFNDRHRVLVLATGDPYVF